MLHGYRSGTISGIIAVVGPDIRIITRPRRDIRRVIIWLALGLAATACAVVVSVAWIDRPLAYFVQAHFSRPARGAFGFLSSVPNPLVPLAIVSLLILGVRMAARRPLNLFYAAVFLASVAILVGETIKDQLKFVFSRTWPTSWMGNHPSLIDDGAFGFHWFHGGTAYQSFPSGHMAAVCAGLSVFWTCYPRWRPLYVSVASAVGVLLIVGNYHFLSDVIAGASLGIVVGGFLGRLSDK